MSEENVRLQNLEIRQDRVESAILSIDKSLQKIVMLEEKHAQTREILTDVVSSVKSIDNRVSNIEIDMPQLREARSWMVAGVGIALSLILIGLVGLLIHA